jgi:hypothetical protein
MFYDERQIIQYVDGDGRVFITILNEDVLFNTLRRQQTASQQQQSAADSGRM